jgi:hypothetical protein
VYTREVLLGSVGEVVTATRGKAGPGEVLLSVAGGRETYTAWSDEPLPCGTHVAVFEARSDRSVDVMELPGS